MPTLVLNAQTRDYVYLLKQRVNAETNRKDKANLLIQLGKATYPTNKVEALEAAKEALKIAETIREYPVMLDALELISNIYKNSSDSESKIQYHLKWNELAGQLKDSAQLINSLWGLGDYYSANKNYSRSITTKMKVLDLAKKLNDQSTIARLNFEIGKEFYLSGEYTTALNYLNRAELEFTNVKGLAEDFALTEVFLSKCYLSLNRPDKAFVFAYKAENKLGSELTNPNTRITILANMASVYLAKKDYPKTREYLRKAQNLITPDTELELQKVVYHQLYELYDGLDEKAKALRFLQSWVDTREKQIAEQAKKQYTSLLLQSELNKKNVEISQLAQERTVAQEENSRKSTMNALLVAVVILLIVSIILATNYSRNRNKSLIETRAQKAEIERQHKDIQKQKKLLEASNRRLDELNREKNNLISVVAHDLKSPLKQIMGLIQIIRMEQQGMSVSQIDCLDRIDSSSKRLSAMIGKVLDLAAIEENKLSIASKPINLVELIEQAIGDFQKEAVSKGIDLDFQQHGFNSKVLADPQLLYEVLANLISNAIKFSGRDSLVQLKLKESRDQVELMVHDNGPGFTEQDLKLAFKKFQKLSARPTGGESSSGLGLSIVKKYVEAMDGKIILESVHGHGATFYIRLNKA